MKNFNFKEEVFNYIIEQFGTNPKTILIRGSTAKGSVNKFSDFDVEIYDKKEYPIYEIHLFKDEPILLSIYFYDLKEGKVIDIPDNVKILKGEYTIGVENVFNTEINNNNPYNEKEIIIRKCQLTIDFFFKFMRTRKKDDLINVQKKLDFKLLK